QDPDIIFAGFDLRDSDLKQGDGWFFLIQEQPTEPRFGFDQALGRTPVPLTKWRDATWLQTGVAEGGYLVLGNANNRVKVTIDGLTFGRDSAHMAAITLQQPMRVAVHSKFLANLI